MKLKYVLELCIQIKRTRLTQVFFASGVLPKCQISISGVLQKGPAFNCEGWVSLTCINKV